MTRGQWVMLGLVFCLTMFSAVLVVDTKYRSRVLFSEQQRISAQRDEIDVEWGRLQLELATWARHDRVSRLAVQDLDMRVPSALEIKVLRF